MIRIAISKRIAKLEALQKRFDTDVLTDLQKRTSETKSNCFWKHNLVSLEE